MVVNKTPPRHHASHWGIKLGCQATSVAVGADVAWEILSIHRIVGECEFGMHKTLRTDAVLYHAASSRKPQAQSIQPSTFKGSCGLRKGLVLACCSVNLKTISPPNLSVPSLD